MKDNLRAILKNGSSVAISHQVGWINVAVQNNLGQIYVTLILFGRVIEEISDLFKFS